MNTESTETNFDDIRDRIRTVQKSLAQLQSLEGQLPAPARLDEVTEAIQELNRRGKGPMAVAFRFLSRRSLRLWRKMSIKSRNQA